MNEEDPLKGLYMDRHDVDRQKLRDALDELIGIDRDTGEPIYLDQYFELSNKQKFVTQLLYREAAVLLEDRDEEEQGDNSEGFAEMLESSASAVQNYASELEFVEADETRGGYVIRPHHTSAAVQFINDGRSGGDET